MSAVDGSPELAEQLGKLLGPRHPVAAVATITPEGVRVASIGTGLGNDFEIGSISKGLTGMLYVDAVERGEVEPNSRLGEHLPLGNVPAAGVTLQSLTVHRSGLPRLPRSAQPFRRTLDLWRKGTNPYGEDLDQLITQARKVAVGAKRPRYSNFGFELLGHALAGAADTDYTSLVRRRIAEPLKLDSVYVPSGPAELRPGALIGQSRGGRTREPWTGQAIGPAGGIRASIADMARLASALLDSTASGIAALDPVASMARNTRIGAGWVITEIEGRTVTWHNGGTGGFRSWLGIDREAGHGVVVLTATSGSVDHHGFRLLLDH
jgi:CubicO group peptidase (beta-lactamase class C family)